MNNDTVITTLQSEVIQFGEKRGWGKYHSPKNLAMALSVEASELTEIFQWLTEEESKQLGDESRKRAGMELADIFMYTLMLCERMDIDLELATKQKIKLNETRFPLVGD